MDLGRRGRRQEAAATSLPARHVGSLQLSRGSGRIEIKMSVKKKKFPNSITDGNTFLGSHMTVLALWAGFLFKGSTFVLSFNVAVISHCIRLKSQQKSTMLFPLIGEAKKNFKDLSK